MTANGSYRDLNNIYGSAESHGKTAAFKTQNGGRRNKILRNACYTSSPCLFLSFSVRYLLARSISFTFEIT